MAAPHEAVITIVEQPPVRFTHAEFHTIEGSPLRLDIEATLDAPTSQPVDVKFTTSPGTATPPDDYIHKVGVFHFDPMQIVATVTVYIPWDDDQEPNKTFYATLSDPSNAVLGSPEVTAITVYDGDTFQAFNLHALHVEHDLIHLQWQQTGYFDGLWLNRTGWEFSRRDADVGGAWSVLAEASHGGFPELWRDFFVESGQRYEYRVVPVYGTHVGDESIWTATDPIPAASGPASQTVAPGFASVEPGTDIPEAANAYVGRHDYRFTLLPDPGPEFEAGTMIDVFVDEQPGEASPDEPPQPWTLPFNALARDELGCLGVTGTPALSNQPCGGTSCDIVVPDLATGVHLIRFVVTDASGTSQRAIAQDLHPWWAAVAEDTDQYPRPLVYLFSPWVSSQIPMLQLSGPVMPNPPDSLDCSDAVDSPRFRVYEYEEGANTAYGSVNDDGLGFLTPLVPWQDASSHTFLLSWFDRSIGRNIIKRGVSGDSWGGAQTLDSSQSSIDPAHLTVDLSIATDEPPAVTWVTPALVSEDSATEIWTEIWLRVEDHDQDVDPFSVTVANLTYDGGVQDFSAYYADPAQQIRPQGTYGWFVCRLPVVVSGSELANQLLIHVEDIGGHVVDEPDFAITRYLVQPGDYPVPLISAPDPHRYYGDGETVTMNATSSVHPDGYEMWFAALVDDGSDPMSAIHVTESATGSFTTSDLDEAYVIRAVIATPDRMPSDAELRGRNLPCLIGDPDLGCASTELVIHRAESWQPTAFEAAYAFPEQVMLRWAGPDDLYLERSEDGGQNWSDLGLTPTHYYFDDTTVVEGATYHYRARDHIGYPWS